MYRSLAWLISTFQSSEARKGNGVTVKPHVQVSLKTPDMN